MPKQASVANRKASARTKPAQKKKSVSNDSWFTKNKLIGLLFIGLFAAFGTYYLLQSSAAPNDPRNAANPARGIDYRDIKLAENGPCAESGEAISPSDTHEQSPEHRQHAEHALSSDNAKCYHLDAGPPGVDLRERIKNIDAELAAQVAYDEKNPAKNADETPPAPMTEANVGSAGSLSAVSPVNWPCVGTGVDGSRVVMMYAYKSGATDRGSSLRSSFESIARRTNAVYHNSGVSSGGSRQVRFHTDSSCRLTIVPVTITGDIFNYQNILTQLRNKGYSSSVRKYLVMVDADTAGKCGVGDRYADARPGQDNPNNSGNMFAVTWKGCWNYGEPHELTHMMGAVQNAAPWTTGRGHCKDQNDVMCYDDDGAGSITMSSICTSSTDIWRLDCRKDTYFKSANATGWLASNWNVANNRFLHR